MHPFLGAEKTVIRILGSARMRLFAWCGGYSGEECTLRETQGDPFGIRTAAISNR
jgi:hypothetical protein